MSDNYRELFFDKQDQLLAVTKKALALQKENELWKARANALLEVFQAASAMTQAPFTIGDGLGCVSITRRQYEKLKDAVEKYTNECLAEMKAAEHCMHPTNGGLSQADNLSTPAAIRG